MNLLGRVSRIQTNYCTILSKNINIAQYLDLLCALHVFWPFCIDQMHCDAIANFSLTKYMKIYLWVYTYLMLFYSVVLIFILKNLICRNLMRRWVATRSPWMPRAGMFLGDCGRGSMLTADVASGSARSATRRLLLTASVSSSMQEPALLARTREEAFLWRGMLHSAIFCSTTCLLEFSCSPV